MRKQVRLSAEISILNFSAGTAAETPSKGPQNVLQCASSVSPSLFPLGCQWNTKPPITHVPWVVRGKFNSPAESVEDTPTKTLEAEDIRV